MIGPSSSHTAGAVRIGKMARSILGQEPTAIKLHFYGSLAETYQGHMTDAGTVAGLLNLDVDDPQIKNALQLAKSRGIEIEILKQTKSDKNPNTIEMELQSASHFFRIEDRMIAKAIFVFTYHIRSAKIAHHHEAQVCPDVITRFYRAVGCLREYLLD